MKAKKLLKGLGVLILILFAGCTNDQTTTYKTYVFTKPYCETVTVGGIVGLAEKCFKIGDIVTGKEIKTGKLTLRIAEHSAVNDGPLSSASYQEFLDVPLIYLAINK
jgi:hypothetical protein